MPDGPQQGGRSATGTAQGGDNHIGIEHASHITYNVTSYTIQQIMWGASPSLKITGGGQYDRNRRALASPQLYPPSSSSIRSAKVAQRTEWRTRAGQATPPHDPGGTSPRSANFYASVGSERGKRAENQWEPSPAANYVNNTLAGLWRFRAMSGSIGHKLRQSLL